uniref:Cytochrome b n=1 Tax=Loxosceles similis TaxID=321804 RepID=A0A4P8VXV3_LOXSM|nr:cytochrome b [Loxosceles similis]QCS26179.1 cytochrome b [Loxosceles similis]
MLLKSVRSMNLLKLLNGSFVDLASPSNLSYMWNFGSLLGVFLLFQFITGLFLAIHYSCEVMLSFMSIIHIERDVNWGWLNRALHSNGASIFFFVLYLHVGRGLYYGSYMMKNVWLSGVTLFLVSMAVAFLGYVLPWGQMSYWAATVITNLFSAVPFVGFILVEWIWGGFGVSNPTLTRFFSFHYLFPFFMIMLVMFHLFFLHNKGSGNILGIYLDKDKVVFHWFYVVKDVLGLVLLLLLFVFISLEFPYFFMDVENFVMSDPLVTPIHIQPEWYFLFAYAILRSVPNKIGGVLALLVSIMILYTFPFVLVSRFNSVGFYGVAALCFWVFVNVWVLLTWGGSCVVEEPYILVSQIMSILYFFMMFVFSILKDSEDLLMS